MNWAAILGATLTIAGLTVGTIAGGRSGTRTRASPVGMFASPVALSGATIFLFAMVVDEQPLLATVLSLILAATAATGLAKAVSSMRRPPR